MTKQISSNHFIPYLCNMKKHLTFKSQQLSTIFWLLIAGTFWIQFLNMSTSICEATLLTICISGSYMLVNQYLCNHLLKKAIRTKQMKPFWILFIVLCIPTSTLVASYFVLFQYLEQTGIFPVSNIFIEGEENLLFNSILLLPGTLVINPRLLRPVLLFRKPAIRKREISIPLPDITAANHPSLHVQCAESHQYPDAG